MSRHAFLRCAPVLALLLALPSIEVVAQSNSPPPFAGAGLDEIIVTATKRNERAEDVPISLTAFDESALQRLGADRFEDFVYSVPGLSYSSNGANTGVFAIRGISTSTLAGNTQSPVAIYYDDLPALDSFAPITTPDLRLFDVARVEVLRGPQGTLFGSGAEGGAIRITTAKPGLEAFEVKSEASLETTEGGGPSTGVSAAVNLPVVSSVLGIRLVGYYRHDGGWVDNHQSGATDVNREDSSGGRALVKWVPTEGLTVNGLISYQDDRPHDSAYVPYGAENYVGATFTPQFDRTHFTTYSLNATYDLPFATLTDVSTYSTRSDVIARDFTPVVQGAFGSFGVTQPAPFEDFGPSDTFAEEVRLASRTDDRLRWLVGLFYLHNKRDLGESLYISGAGRLLAPLGFPSDYLFTAYSELPSTEKALFGEISYELTPQWTSTIGARTVRNALGNSTSADGIFNGGPSLVTRSTTENATTPKYVLSYTPVKDILLYAQVAKGYRVGQNNLSPPTDPRSGLPIPQSYGPDHLWNYELGLKSTWLERRLLTNLAVYDIEWSQIQLQANSASHYNYVDNAGQARSRGVELELRLSPTTPLELGLSGAYTDALLTQVNPGVDALIGDRLPGTPRFAYSDFAEWTFSGAGSLNFYARAEHRYSGRAFSDLNNPTALQFGNYNLFGARAGVRNERWEAVLYVENLANKYAYQNAVELPIGPSAIPLRPRTVGVTIRTQF